MPFADSSAMFANDWKYMQRQYAASWTPFPPQKFRHIHATTAFGDVSTHECAACSPPKGTLSMRLQRLAASARGSTDGTSEATSSSYRNSAGSLARVALSLRWEPAVLPKVPLPGIVSA